MLPKIETPVYKIEVPSTKEIVEYRPFLVKEEKILLTAMEGAKDKEENEFEGIVRDTIIKIIGNCTEGKVDGNKLPTFDVDYLFLNIRTKSRGEVLKPSFNCQNVVDGETCGESNEVIINLNDVKIKFPKEDKSKIMINDSVGIQMKYISTEELKYHDKENDDVEKMFKIIVDSIDYIFDNDQIYKSSETPKAEMMKFVETLTEEVFDKIKEFFASVPRLEHTFEYKCSKCGYKEDVTLAGLDAFFGLA